MNGRFILNMAVLFLLSAVFVISYELHGQEALGNINTYHIPGLVSASIDYSIDDYDYLIEGMNYLIDCKNQNVSLQECFEERIDILNDNDILKFSEGGCSGEESEESGYYIFCAESRYKLFDYSSKKIKNIRYPFVIDITS